MCSTSAALHTDCFLAGNCLIPPQTHVLQVWFCKCSVLTHCSVITCRRALIHIFQCCVLFVLFWACYDFLVISKMWLSSSVTSILKVWKQTSLWLFTPWVLISQPKEVVLIDFYVFQQQPVLQVAKKVCEIKTYSCIFFVHTKTVILAPPL